MQHSVVGNVKNKGFALPTVVLVSTVMIAILVTSIAAAAASRVALDSQYYNRLAQYAVESGIARANECLKKNGYTPQWQTSSESRDLKPNTDCSGNPAFASAYVLDTLDNVDAAPSTASELRTSYSVEAESGSGVGSSIKVTGKTELVRSAPPHAVWRTYSQVSYIQIEPPRAIACPEGFIGVPGNSLFNTSDFCVGKYEASSVGGKAASSPGGTPIVNINQVSATAAAADACAGCRLMTDAEWLTIAHNIANVASNWSGGSVGSGYIYRGHSNSSPPGVQPTSANDNDGYFSTGDSSGSDQRRTFRLDNGQVIWDFAGNAYEWTSGQITSGKPGGSGLGWRDWNTIPGPGSISPNPLPSFGTPAASAWNYSRGLGRLYSNSDDVTTRGFLRGGAWHNGLSSGVFSLVLSAAPTGADASIGFRLAL